MGEYSQRHFLRAMGVGGDPVLGQPEEIARSVD